MVRQRNRSGCGGQAGDLAVNILYTRRSGVKWPYLLARNAVTHKDARAPAPSMAVPHMNQALLKKLWDSLDQVSILDTINRLSRNASQFSADPLWERAREGGGAASINVC